jgi:hypothetical protein
MTLVKGSTVTLTGHKEDNLKTQLELYYDHSATAKKLLNEASAITDWGRGLGVGPQQHLDIIYKRF